MRPIIISTVSGEGGAMPSVLTHDFFGRDVYGAVGTELGFTTTDEMDAFLLGNQGPDPLFYLVLNPLFDKSSHVGTLMHDEKPTELLLAMRTSIEEVPTWVMRPMRTTMSS